MTRFAPLLLVLAACGPEITRIQGLPGEDVWTQAPTDQVDILWVVDNSTSMQTEQELLAAGFESFISSIEQTGADFHIGVVTTDFDYDSADRGKLVGVPPVITKQDDYVALFQERALVGLGGSGREKGLEVAEYALSPTMTTGPNAGFLREAANLLVVIVSDEEDCSDRGALGPDPENTACYAEAEKLASVTSFVTHLQDLKDDKDKVQLAVIVGPEKPTTEACDDATVPGSRYIDAARLTGGLVGDICEADWSELLYDLGLNAAGIFTRFFLDSPIAPDSLVVTVDGDEAPFLGYVETGGSEDWVPVTTLEAASHLDGYVYDVDAHAIEFFNAWVPERGSEVMAKYTKGSGD